jgi:hypothetical protein
MNNFQSKAPQIGIFGLKTNHLATLVLAIVLLFVFGLLGSIKSKVPT